MPITLGCPSCGKRFRARDESAGKRVKCPYCAEPVPVPTGDEQEQAQHEQAQQQMQQRSPLDDDDGIGTVPTRQNPQPGGPTVASPTDWGADSPPPRPSPFPPVQNAPPGPAPVFPPVRAPSSPGFDPFPKLPPAAAPASAAGRSRESMTRLGGAAGRPLGTGVGAGPIGASPMGPAEPLAIPGWKKARRGMYWVLLGLFVLALPAFVGFAKAACAKGGVALPRGPGGDWVSIAGYVNTTDPNSIMLSKEELVNLAGYGVPVVLGGLFLSLGRLACGGVPRSSGAKGMFILSGLATPFAVAALLGAAGCDKLAMREEYPYFRYAFLILAVAAEFWFLAGLVSAGVTLKRPQAARAVGLLGLVVAVAAAVATIGWMAYEKRFQPRPVTDAVRMYEQAALMVGWLLVLGAYWRAVRSTRGAISEYLETVEV
ncbi:unnamed protein product [Gemmataceae bacterium]|nr:unnamed protein product [Gemmataceae bacterium]VTU00452.1 unnamed protein product [Gemmataceae bacterium]